MKTISRYIMTLALLLTAVTGAWAEDTYNVTFKANGNTKTVENITLPKTFSCSYNDANDELDRILKELYGWTGTSGVTYCDNHSSLVSSDASNVTAGVNGNNQYITINGPFAGSVTVTGTYHVINKNTDYSLEITFPGVAEEIEVTPGEAAIDVKWDPSTKTGNFAMPGSDVVLTPIYAKAAAFATTGTEPEVTTLLPEAAEGVIAGTDASLIKEGTGIVAFAGTSTEVKQGTLMYAIGTSATEAPDLDAADTWSTDVPTAENVADDGATVYVWYYIKGADTPQGQTATAENTFNDSEPACLTVTVLTNKFDITFKAANDNTIEAGKATVTVGGTAATVTEGKLQGVKMGSEVKVKANTGYKFRKVEVKKKAVGPTYPVALSAVTADYVGSVVCSDGNVYPAKTAAPAGKTAVGILGKVTETGHGLILALQDAALQEWETINGWTSVTTYAGTTLKLLPDNAARGTNLTSYTTLGETTVSNWAVAQKDDYVAIFTNLGSTTGDSDGITCSESMDVYITPAGGTSIWMASVLDYISATSKNDEKCWGFNYRYWKGVDKNRTNGKNVRPVLGF